MPIPSPAAALSLRRREVNARDQRSILPNPPRLQAGSSKCPRSLCLQRARKLLVQVRTVKNRAEGEFQLDLPDPDVVHAELEGAGAGFELSRRGIRADDRELQLVR